ncbi:hypothetical protein PR048_001403 [Dryococelus australis]|uniref:Uncharacterized protein n=1 Tax=Dryococelus australis TaxID=614101 RepID=A0ABQ9IHY5_9NEOP|nr:hypothetical protein PR048_001403 [Dryococelus australis]
MALTLRDWHYDSLRKGVIHAADWTRGLPGIIGYSRGPRENPPTNAIVRHDTHMRKSGVTRPGIEPGSPWWEASRLTARLHNPLYSRAGDVFSLAAAPVLPHTGIRILFPCKSAIGSESSRACIIISDPIVKGTFIPGLRSERGVKKRRNTSVRRGRKQEYHEELRHANSFQNKTDFKLVYTEFTFAIGSEFIIHGLENFEPIANLQGNKKRIPYYQDWDNTVECRRCAPVAPPWWLSPVENRGHVTRRDRRADMAYHTRDVEPRTSLGSDCARQPARRVRRTSRLATLSPAGGGGGDGSSRPVTSPVPFPSSSVHFCPARRGGEVLQGAEAGIRCSKVARVGGNREWSIGEHTEEERPLVSRTPAARAVKMAPLTTNISEHNVRQSALAVTYSPARAVPQPIGNHSQHAVLNQTLGSFPEHRAANQRMGASTSNEPPRRFISVDLSIMWQVSVFAGSVHRGEFIQHAHRLELSFVKYELRHRGESVGNGLPGAAVHDLHQWRLAFYCRRGCPGAGDGLVVRVLACHLGEHGSLQDFTHVDPCRMMPLVGGFSRGSPVSPALKTSFTPGIQRVKFLRLSEIMFWFNALASLSVTWGAANLLDRATETTYAARGLRVDGVENLEDSATPKPSLHDTQFLLPA